MHYRAFQMEVSVLELMQILTAIGVRGGGLGRGGGVRATAPRIFQVAILGPKKRRRLFGGKKKIVRAKSLDFWASAGIND